MKRTVYAITVLLSVFCLSFRAHAQSPAPQQALNQYVADLQSNPNDTALREKIIALAQSMNPEPAIPEDAREHYVMAATFMESAKDASGFTRAVEQYKAALLIAPWWADAYKKLAIAQKAAAQYDDAIASLNLYLLTQPADARDAQDEIYKLKALNQAAADDRANQVRQQQEEQQRQREEQQRAYAASPEGQFQALLRKIDGRRYTTPSSNGDLWTIDVRDGVLVFGFDTRTDCPGHGRTCGWHEWKRVGIQGRETTEQITTNLIQGYNGTAVYTISDDGERITESMHYVGGQTDQMVLTWDR